MSYFAAIPSRLSLEDTPIDPPAWRVFRRWRRDSGEGRAASRASALIAAGATGEQRIQKAKRPTLADWPKCLNLLVLLTGIELVTY